LQGSAKDLIAVSKKADQGRRKKKKKAEHLIQKMKRLNRKLMKTHHKYTRPGRGKLKTLKKSSIQTHQNTQQVFVPRFGLIEFRHVGQTALSSQYQSSAKLVISSSGSSIFQIVV
jgi:hypothetical protein